MAKTRTAHLSLVGRRVALITLLAGGGAAWLRWGTPATGRRGQIAAQRRRQPAAAAPDPASPRRRLPLPLGHGYGGGYRDPKHYDHHRVHRPAPATRWGPCRPVRPDDELATLAILPIYISSTSARSPAAADGAAALATSSSTATGRRNRSSTGDAGATPAATTPAPPSSHPLVCGHPIGASYGGWPSSTTSSATARRKVAFVGAIRGGYSGTRPTWPTP